jgi:hypothetical protein
MKTKISIVLISVLFMMACGTSEQQEAPKQESNKMVLKAYNNMYVIIVGDTALIANQPDSTKAEVFEKIDQGNGKWALKTSGGKFITDDGTKLVANRTEVQAWELFEIIPVEGSQINLKSYTGKIVCVDGGMGARLFSNRDQASTWETLTVEPR